MGTPERGRVNGPRPDSTSTALEALTVHTTLPIHARG